MVLSICSGTAVAAAGGFFWMIAIGGPLAVLIISGVVLRLRTALART